MKINKARLRTLLTIGACVGVAATGYVGIYEGKKAEEDSWRDYKWTILTGIVTTGAIVTSHKVATKHIAAVGASLAAYQTLARQTEAKIREKLGDEKWEEIKKEVSLDRAKKKLKSVEKKSQNGVDMFYEPATDQYFYGTMEGVMKAYNELLRKFIRDPRDVYDEKNNEEALGASINDWIKLLQKYNPKSGLMTVDYCEEEFGWYYGDADGIWNDLWSYFGTPWIDVNLEYITEGPDEGYWFMSYGTVEPAWAFPDKAYRQNVKDAKMRWENEYA